MKDVKNAFHARIRVRRLRAGTVDGQELALPSFTWAERHHGSFSSLPNHGFTLWTPLEDAPMDAHPEEGWLDLEILTFLPG